ncbi:glycosyltransferase family 2 protein [Litorisediminicola beolgyonensis]|uniref:Glycosyltransferase family 2 protein n=1 Tax=Litorisediminicola beolgyonensis TaxID=1173614 RepID=A0ABW3ZD60_9RHOB
MTGLRHAPRGTARWDVVTTAREPAPLIAAFVAHHLALGASRIHLYLDAPDPEIEALLAPVREVRMTFADARFHRHAYGGRRSPRLNRRQRLNAQHAYRRSEADWLLHLDADEFVMVADLDAQLAELPPEIGWLRLVNGERAYLKGARPRGLFDGVMLLPSDNGGLPRWMRRGLFSGQGGLRPEGLLGHARGKSAVRCGQALSMGVHSPRVKSDLGEAVSGEVAICHFDGLTPAHWQGKLLRYAAAEGHATQIGAAGSRQRVLQLQAFAALGGNATAARALHDRLRCLTDVQLELRQARGLVRDIPFDPTEAARARFADAGYAYSAEEFDRCLMPERQSAVGV